MWIQLNVIYCLMGPFMRQTERTRRHVFEMRRLHCQQRRLTSLTQGTAVRAKGPAETQKKGRGGGGNQAQVAFVNFEMQRSNKIYNALLLALTVALFPAGRLET